MAWTYSQAVALTFSTACAAFALAVRSVTAIENAVLRTVGGVTTAGRSQLRQGCHSKQRENWSEIVERNVVLRNLRHGMVGYFSYD